MCRQIRDPQRRRKSAPQTPIMRSRYGFCVSNHFCRVQLIRLVENMSSTFRSTTFSASSKPCRPNTNAANKPRRGARILRHQQRPFSQTLLPQRICHRRSNMLTHQIATQSNVSPIAIWIALLSRQWASCSKLAKKLRPSPNRIWPPSKLCGHRHRRRTTNRSAMSPKCVRKTVENITVENWQNATTSMPPPMA